MAQESEPTTDSDDRFLRKVFEAVKSLPDQEPPKELMARTEALIRQMPEPSPPWWRITFFAVILALGHIASVAGVVNFTSSALSNLDYWSAMQHWQLAGGGIFCGAAYLLARLFQGSGKKRATQVCLVITGVGIVGLATMAIVVPEVAKSEIRKQLAVMFQSERWVTYEPPEWNPHEPTSMPNEEKIQQQLKLLRDEGFDGVLTFSTQGTLARVPELAKRVGFRSVVVGIYIERDDEGNVLREKDGRVRKPMEQFSQAIKPDVNRWVDGICIGHNPPSQLDYETLASWMAELRHATHKPVTTTLPLLSYLGNRGQPLREIGDWYCPDVSLAWPSRFDEPEKAVDELRERLRDIAELPRDRPVLLKMVGYPSGPLNAGFTPDKQKEFFTLVSRNLQLPTGTHICYFSGFDLPWKGRRPVEEFAAQEEFIGLFSADLQSKPAVAVVKKGFLVQKRK